ncbi:MAG TPA: glycosyltransferase [Syntrophorhabdaceae bacterium]|nr:glycosyltransferase [Syntrophorhabdaceae bacterium]
MCTVDSAREIKCIDLHVHSKYSEPSTDWFMQGSQISESYSDPFSIYESAKRSGMSFVTITDHNRIDGCLYLKEKYGDDVLMGVETTAYFPEDRCKIHLLIYGMTEAEFLVIQRLRKDIYELRAYLKERGLAHSVAHATYSVETGKLTAAHLEKLVVLFNTFEIINGGRNKTDNLAWKYILENLTPQCLELLIEKHAIEPFDAEPWIKGFTAGSDDHGGLFVGATYTEAACDTVSGFIQALRNKKTAGEGRQSDYRSLVFTVCKVVHDFSRQSRNAVNNSFMGRIAEVFFDGKRLGIADRFRLKRLKARAKQNADPVSTSFVRLTEAVEGKRCASVDERVDEIYASLAKLSDSYLELLFNSLDLDMAKLDLFAVARSIQACLPGFLLSMPFLISLRHLTQNRTLVERLRADLSINKAEEGRRVLWFTDSLTDLNGVSATLNEIGRLAHEQGFDMKIVTSIDSNELNRVPPNVINLASIRQIALPYYDRYKLRIPSVLTALKEVYQIDPDRIFISTPGPIGMLGLIAAKLMNVKCTGFYHTDFAGQAREIVEDESVAHMLESYTRWFYSAMDEVMVPTVRYMEILAQRGFDTGRMRLFKRGFDLDRFRPARAPARDLSDGINLLYVGRVSKDKGLNLLIEAHSRIMAKRSDVNLLIVGDGPLLDELRSGGHRGVHFAGRVVHPELPDIYSSSHLFVFPSTTDTFGKAVLEAQACGLPAIVSDMGGPQEIILHGATGFVARAHDVKDWQEKIEYMLDMMKATPLAYERMRQAAHSRAKTHYTWEGVHDLLTEGGGGDERITEKKIA